MSSSVSVNPEMIQAWLEAKLEAEAIVSQLKQSGYTDETIAEYLTAYKKKRHAGRRFNGFLLAGLGAVLGFVSCILTITNPFPELYNAILFGLTSIAILLICLGLYFLFE